MQLKSNFIGLEEAPEELRSSTGMCLGDIINSDETTIETDKAIDYLEYLISL